MDSPTAITDQTPKEKPVVITSLSSKKPMFKFSLVNPKILGAMVVLVLLIGGIGTGVYLTQTPQQTTTQASLQAGVDLTFKPQGIETVAGNEFTVDIYADAHDNQITSTDLGITYDPEALTLKSITPGQFLPKILVPPDIKSGTAFISLGTDGNSGASGNGIIAGLVFEANLTASKSSSEITFDSEKTSINVLNRDAENAQDNFGNSQVNVNPALPTAENPAVIAPPTATSTAFTEPEILDTPAASESATTTDAETSDFNSDGLTNSLDLSLLYSGWGDPETDAQKRADLNNDGKINGLDYSQLLTDFNR